ncbi:VOC family protein [Sphingomonas bacterium]|uniref:VOC family protein n=1 Tax=Sphingomonas bacterium TaxID=1895847 RepID=UPI00157508C0|nr:VOC family protein [Sphingomonas bacterium]
MTKMIFVNLPVADVAASTAFYEAIGFVKDETLATGPDAAMLRWSDDVSFTLLSHARFADFAPKPIADSRATSAILFAFALDSREEVDAITAKAVAAGGQEGHEPEDMGFMYSRAFDDLDGHSFGPMWMDVAAAVAAMSTDEAGAT